MHRALADAHRARIVDELDRRPGGLDARELAQTVVELLNEKGFRAEAADGEIRMHRCPFHELVDNGARVVCTIHHGLVCSGALSELGSGLEVERLDAFVEPQLCVARLTPRTTHTAARPEGSQTPRQPRSKGEDP